MKPHLTTSPEAGDQLLAGQGVEQGQVAEDAGRLVEGADEVLARAGVDAGLAADGGVDHREQAGRQVHHPDAAQPGRGHEAAQVGRRAATQGDDGVGARELRLAEGLPAARRLRCGLGLLAVGHGEEQHVAVTQDGPHPVGQVAQSLGMHESDPLGRLSQHPGQPVEQVAADDHVVRRRAAHVEGRGAIKVVAHGTATLRRISSATSSGVRPSVSTVSVATAS